MRHDPALPSTPATLEDLIWAAGFFEGEGTVRINTPTRRNAGHLVASVVNTDRALVDWFQQRWPGYSKVGTGLGPRQRPAWVWLCAATKAAAFLLAILPHLRSERVRTKALLGLEFQAQKDRSHLNRHPDYLARQQAYYEQMKVLNRRGMPLP